MNLFVALVMGACVALAELGSVLGVSLFPDIIPAQSPWPSRLCAILVCTLAAPLLAVFQTWWVSEKMRCLGKDRVGQNRIVKFIAFFHGLVWAVSSVVVFSVLGWPYLLAGLKSLPGVYELMLLVPLLFSMMLSWLVFYDIQAIAHYPTEKWSLRLRQRLAYLEVRLRMHLMLITAPLLAIMVARRYAHWLEQLTPGWAVVAALVVCLLVMGVVPWLMTRLWKTERIGDLQLDRKLMAICQQAGAGVRQIKVWRTGHQIVNAAVTGLLPGTRIILLTDLLLKQFEPEEVEAIVRHEAGHVRLKHLPLKMLFVVLPMLVLLLDRTSQYGIANQLAQGFAALGWGLAADNVTHLVAIGFAVYLLVVLRWLSHKMEFEADLFAATETMVMSGNTSVADAIQGVQQTRAALWRLAALSPGQFRKRTFMHPSLKERILFIEKVAVEPAIANAYRRSFARWKWMLMGLWGVVLLVPLLLAG